MTITERTPEIVHVAIGVPADPTQKMWPVTIFDQDSRRVTYVRVPRDQIAVMGEAKTALWTAYWSAGSWRLVDIIAETAEAA